MVINNFIASIYKYILKYIFKQLAMNLHNKDKFFFLQIYVMIIYYAIGCIPSISIEIGLLDP